MLAIRTCCEHCACQLPSNSDRAFICSFECTFCQDCVALLENVCPNCGGGFEKRPVRPSENLKNGHYVVNFPAEESSLHRPVELDRHVQFAASIKDKAPHRR